MSGLDSWEDDADAQGEDANLSRRAQQMNINAQQQAGILRPGAHNFQPGVPSFQPQQFQQYGSGYPQYANQGYPQGGYSYQQYGQYNGYGGGGYNQQQFSQYQSQPQQPQPPQQQFQQQQRPSQRQPQQQQQAQPQAPPVIAKRADNAQNQARPAAAGAAATQPPKVGAKVLSIGGDEKPKVEKSGQAKVLSLGSEAAPASAPAKDTAAKNEPTAGSKAAAAKAIERTGESTSAGGSKTSPSSSGRNSPTPKPEDKEKEKAAAAASTKTAEAIAKEQQADVDDETLQEMYGKEHVNVIFLGHVDAGKSTLGGSILIATGQVDERTLEKYKKEAEDAGKPSWYISWALDLTKEERSKGKTVEVGRGFFETEKRQYSILDAPGHKTYVGNMIGGASQADVGVLVISARKGEYETGFEKGGQTREHAMLAKTQGVNKLIIAVNKMDDPTVEWSKERYEECLKKPTQFLKGLGYNPKTDLTFMPVSAQASLGIKDRVPKDLAPWYDGPSLLEYLDSMQTLERKVKAPFMMPIFAKYRDLGTMVEGKIESGVIKKGVNYLMMPSREQVSISALYGETEEEIDAATCGEQVRVRIRGVEEEDILPGFILCSPKRPVHCVNAFEAQIRITELKSILSAGFNCVMHVHAATEEVTFAALLHKLEKGTGRKSKKPPGYATRGMDIIARLEVTGTAKSVCVEAFDDYPQLGRFTLRDQGQTIAIGKITKLITDSTA